MITLQVNGGVHRVDAVRLSAEGEITLAVDRLT